jgi:hypothetical protein
MARIEDWHKLFGYQLQPDDIHQSKMLQKFSRENFCSIYILFCLWICYANIDYKINLQKAIAAPLQPNCN